jgi:hypothetical protein
VPVKGGPWPELELRWERKATKKRRRQQRV